MIYVILGIIVLIASFIIALVSLVYEQNKLEKKQEEALEQSGLLEANVQQDKVGDVHDIPKTGTEYGSWQNTKPVLEKQKIDEGLPPEAYGGSPSAAGEQNANYSDEGAWWKQLEQVSFQKDELPKSEEDKSIEAIKLELAKMVSGRGGRVAIDKTQETGETEIGDEQKKDQLLSGEFSLGDIKSRD